LALKGHILKLLIGLGLLKLPERLIIGVLIGSRIDLVEDISLMNDVAFFERDTHNVTADSGGNVHQIHGSSSAGKLAPVDNLFLQRLADDHIGRRKSMGGRL
jgi:hypothetical protein